MLLYQEGELDLDAPVQRYVPWFPIKGQPITTRELLGHLAGIRHYNPDELATENQRYYSSLRESVGRFMSTFAPACCEQSRTSVGLRSKGVVDRDPM